MTPRERILAAIDREQIDKLPSDMWVTPEIMEALLAHFGIDPGEDAEQGALTFNGGKVPAGPKAILKLWDELNVDGILNVAPPYIGPELEERNGIFYNEWGFGYEKQRYGSGTYLEQVSYPMAELETIDDLKRYPWPDPDWYDYDALSGLIERCGGRAVNVGYTAVFFFHNLLRGLEQSLVDTVAYPELTGCLVERVSDFFHEYHSRCFEAAGHYIDTTQVTDDFGSQHGLLIGPDVFREFYKAPMQKAIDLAKRYGIKVFHHDDGDMRGLLPELVEMGIDVLNPIQYKCGDWDLGALKAEYGDRVCFHSGVDNQDVLPFGSPEEVKAEVKKLVDTLASDGTGYIVCSSHNIQPNTPVENVVALYEAAYEYGGGD